MSRYQHATQQAKPNYIMGIMSGTSCDGINVAIMDAASLHLAHFVEHPLPAELRESIFRLASPSFNEIDTLGHLDRALGMAFSHAALQTIESSCIPPQRILAIGNHGQTIRHRPKNAHGDYPFTLQIGCAATLAEATGLTVVSDFRRRDIAAYGEGAPLVPFAHRELFAHQAQGTVILNIGGIANITMFDENGGVQGFDTGPGNMLMDALMLVLSDGRYAYDQDGDLARMGKVCQPLLQKLLQHPFLCKAPPKSTGREDFGEQVVHQIMAWQEISDADRMATACAFTAESIARSRTFLHSQPQRWLICGGGAFNSRLLEMLRHALAPATVETTAQHGIPAEAVEALSFAVLSKHTLLGESNTLPEVTGASHAVCGGQITPGKNWADVVKWVQRQS